MSCRPVPLGARAILCAVIAWTLQNYGAYPASADCVGAPSLTNAAVDATHASPLQARGSRMWHYQVEGVPWARCMIAAEDGPAGCVPAQFAKDWGYSMVTQDKAGNPWFTDLIKLFQVLHIVANNGPDAMGGGGTPRQPLAPPFRDGEPSQAVPSNTAGQ